jgi:AraC-like DNA-binding protein
MTLPLRPEWVHDVIDCCQASIGAEDANAGQMLVTLKQLLGRVEPPRTPLEGLLFRGVVADLLLCKMGRLGFVSEAYANLLGSKSSLGAADLVGRVERHPKVALALSVIAASCGQPDLDLAQVASAVRISPWHLSRLIHRETGVGFATHLRRARLSRGALLLESPTKSVKEVAGDAGYKWARDFSRDFARQFGMPPNKWRRLSMK